MKIPYADLSRETNAVADEIKQAVNRVIDSGWYILGNELTSFEEEFASYCDTKYAIGVSNGLDALKLILKAWGIGPEDEVIIAADTFLATALAVSDLGARPIFVDRSIDRPNINPDNIASAITSKTKAIIVTHLYGDPCEMDKVIKIAKQHNLYVFEDAAQAHGAEYKGTKCGNLADAAAFSFYPAKNMGALGDAGGITLNDKDKYEEIIKLRNYGFSKRYYADIVGYNARLDEIQAAVLKVKLGFVDQWNKKRRLLSAIYNEKLKGNINLLVQSELPNTRSVHHVYSILVKDGKRNDLATYLNRHGVGTNIHYPVPPYLQECYGGLGHDSSDFPNASQAAKESLSLPLTAFHTEDEIETVAQLIQNFYNQ